MDGFRRRIALFIFCHFVENEEKGADPTSLDRTELHMDPDWNGMHATRHMRTDQSKRLACMSHVSQHEPYIA